MKNRKIQKYAIEKKKNSKIYKIMRYKTLYFTSIDYNYKLLSNF